MVRAKGERWYSLIQLAEALKLPELKMKLEEMAADEAGHARELRRLLKGL